MGILFLPQKLGIELLVRLFRGDFVVTFRCNLGEFPGFSIRKYLTCNYLVRLEGIEPSFRFFVHLLCKSLFVRHQLLC